MADLYSIVSSQFPEFVRANHPKFVQFIQAYYTWVEQQSIGKIEDVVNIDATSTAFVEYFRSQLDTLGLLSPASPFDLKYLKQIKQIYAAKGSEQALLFLLRLAFVNGDVTINYPSDNILRASDGRWFQQSFITIQRQYGTLSVDDIDSVTDFEIVYDTSRQQIQIAQAVAVDQAGGKALTLRLFFRRRFGVTVTYNQPVELKLNGVVVFRGVIVPSPSSVSITSGGADWVVGQVIEFPGTTVPTLLRVTRVTSTGAISAIEVVQHGYNHANPQTVIVSPYKSRPLGTSFELTEIGTRPGPIQYTLEINDYLEEISDRIVGIVSSPATGYFAETYASDVTYSGLTAINVASTPTTSPQTGFTSSVTLEDWLASRATLVLTYEPLVNIKGKWLNGRGQLSNQSIRLQDNDFYQQFSYEIASNVNPQLYDHVADAVHPAGTKRFDLYKLTTSVDSVPDVSITFPFKTFGFLDATSVQEGTLLKQVTKPLSTDEITTSDLVIVKNVDKYLLTDSTTIDDDANASSTTSGPYSSGTYFADVYATELKTLTLTHA